MTGRPQFSNGKLLFENGKIAMDPECCCDAPLCDCPCCVGEDFGGFKITISPALLIDDPPNSCCDQVGGVYDIYITQELPTFCEGRAEFELECGQLEVAWSIGCSGSTKELIVGVVLRSDPGTAEAFVTNSGSLLLSCADLGFVGRADVLTFPGVGSCANLIFDAESLPCPTENIPTKAPCTQAMLDRSAESSEIIDDIINVLSYDSDFLENYLKLMS